MQSAKINDLAPQDYLRDFSKVFAISLSLAKPPALAYFNARRISSICHPLFRIHYRRFGKIGGIVNPADWGIGHLKIRQNLLERSAAPSILSAKSTTFKIRHSHRKVATQSLEAESAEHPLQTQEMQHILSGQRRRLEQLFQRAPGFVCILNGPRHVYDMANDAYYQLVGHRNIIG